MTTAIKPLHERVCDLVVPALSGFNGPGILRVFGTRDEILGAIRSNTLAGWVTLSALDPTEPAARYATRVDIQCTDISMIVAERASAEVLGAMLKDPDVVEATTTKYNSHAGPADQVQGVVVVEQGLDDEEPANDN